MPFESNSLGRLALRSRNTATLNLSPPSKNSIVCILVYLYVLTARAFRSHVMLKALCMLNSGGSSKKAEYCCAQILQCSVRAPARAWPDALIALTLVALRYAEENSIIE